MATNVPGLDMVLNAGLEEGATVVVVNQKFASTYFGGESPIGRQFAFGKHRT